MLGILPALSLFKSIKAGYHMRNSTEIVINSTLVSNNSAAPFYEFVINETIEVVECGRVESMAADTYTLLEEDEISGMLFELNHIRIDPKKDNSTILTRFIDKLKESGVEIYRRPRQEDLSMCYKPVGELSHPVRFYLESQKPVFLSSAVKLNVIK
jgi:hypothetical protein